jgi:hypothetical protein
MKETANFRSSNLENKISSSFIEQMNPLLHDLMTVTSDDAVQNGGGSSHV